MERRTRSTEKTAERATNTPDGPDQQTSNIRDHTTEQNRRQELPAEPEWLREERESGYGPDGSAPEQHEQHSGETPSQQTGANPAYENAVMLAREHHLRVYPMHRWRNGHCSCPDGAKCEDGGKHPRFDNWQQAATDDLEQLARWNTQYPDANWGVLADRFVAIDADGVKPTDGQPGKAPRECLSDDLWQSAGMIIRTGGGGYQLGFANPEKAPKPGNWVRVLPGVDTRGKGGGTILPGSTSYKGAYTWEREPGPAPWPPLPTHVARELSDNNRRNRADIREKVKGGGPIPEGTRDQAMYQVIADLWNDGLEAEQLLEMALEINRDRCKPPLRDSIIREKVRRRVDQRRQPRQRANAEDLASYQEPSFLSQDMRWTTSGNARRLAVNYADRLCFVAQLGWYYYLGGRWVSDISELVASRLAKDIIALASAWAALPEQTEQLESDDLRAWWRKGWYGNTTYASNHIGDIVRNARSEPELAARAEAFDCDPWLLNTPEAVLDLKHLGRTVPHSPALRHMKQTGAHYQPDATCPQWLAFLNSTFQGDQQLIDYLQLAMGYLLTGDTGEQVWFLFVGRKGRNGKGTFVETIRAVLGDYALPLDINVLLQKAQAQDGNAPKPALAALVNARLATSQEPDGGLKDSARWNASMLKDLTGQDVLQVRDLYGKSFSFLPMVKLIVSVNVVPETKEHTSAVWDRIIPIPFNRYFAPEERNTTLRETLKAEASGILNWMLVGLRRLLELRAQDKSLSDEDVLPEAVKREKRGEQERDDEYAPFFNTVLIYDNHDDAHVTLADAWQAWKDWHSAVKAADPFSAPPTFADARAFAAFAEKRGYPKRRGHNNTTVLCYCRLVTRDASLPLSESGGRGGHGEEKRAKPPLETAPYEGFTDFSSDTSPTSPRVVSDILTFRRTVDALLANARVPVCLDLETNGLCPETNQIITVQLHQEGGPTFIVDWRRSDFTWQEELRRLLSGVRLIGHNLAFDLAMLIGQEGITRRDVTVLHDTLLAEQVIHGRRTRIHDETGDDLPKSYSLEAVAATYGITVAKEQQTTWLAYMPGTPAWTEPFTAEQLAYAARDVAVLPAIMATQVEQLEATEQRPVADLEHRIVPVLADTRAHGPYVDRERWRAVVDGEVPMVARAAQDAREALGNPDINLNSPAQLQAALEAIGVSVPNTREQTLAKVSVESSAAEAILRYRALQKAQGTYGMNWLEKHVSPAGRVHANWQQIGTETGRMACAEPNLQQLPKDAHREAIVAPAGSTLLIADFSNAELRIAAATSGDEAMRSAFREGRDLHSDAARAIFGLEPDEDVRARDSFAPGKSYRDAAKTVNFALIYGTTVYGLADSLGLDPRQEGDLERAKQIMANHRKCYPRLWSWLEQNKRLATARGYAVTPLGRRRYFAVPAKPDHFIADHQEYWEAYGKPLASMQRQAANHPVQGGCADIYKMTIAVLNEAVDAETMHIAMYVHDELVIEVPDEYLDLVEAALKRAIVQAGEWAEVPFPEPEVVRSHHWCKA